jgi:hypothetical protein
MTKYYSYFESLQKINKSKEEKIERGRKFEKLINDFFEDEGILLKRSYQTSDNQSEQIDGAINADNRVILFEVKWVESGLAASELFAFIGKVENKFTGTIGLFISAVPLKDNFLNALNRGRRQSVIVIHGEDIELLLKNDFKMEDYLKYALQNLSIDNLFHIPIKDFLNDDSISKSIKKQSQTSEKDIISNYILSNTDNYTNLLQISNNKSNSKDETFLYFLDNFNDITKYSLRQKQDISIRNNLKNFLSLYFKTSDKKKEFTIKFFELFFKKWDISFLDDEILLDMFSSSFANLDNP